MPRPVVASARSAESSRQCCLCLQTTLLNQFYWFAVPFPVIDALVVIDWMSLMGFCELVALVALAVLFVIS